jgi:hypothetical protein
MQDLVLHQEHRERDECQWPEKTSSCPGEAKNDVKRSDLSACAPSHDGPQPEGHDRSGDECEGDRRSDSGRTESTSHDLQDNKQDKSGASIKERLRTWWESFVVSPHHCVASRTASGVCASSASSKAFPHHEERGGEQCQCAQRSKDSGGGNREP